MDKTPLILRSAENRGQHVVRSVLSRVVIILAAAVILYAVVHNTIPVLVEVTEEKIPEPKDLSTLDPSTMTPEEIEKALNPDPIPVKQLVTQHLPEQAVVKDVTVGGVEYLADGTIKRTYGEGEETADVCPT